LYNDYDDRHDEYDEYAEEPPQKPKKRISYKCIGGMVVAIVALIFVVMLMYMGDPWYTITYEAHQEEATSVDINFEIEYHLTEFKGTNNLLGGNATENTTSYDDSDVKDDFEDIKEVMDNLNTFFMISIILLIISIALIPIAAIGKIPHGIAMATLLIALIITLITPIYFFIYFPPAIERQIDNSFGNMTEDIGFIYDGDFIGSRHGEFPIEGLDLQMNFEMEYGPGMTFWFSFIPMFIILVAIGVYSSGKKDLIPHGPGYRGTGDRPYPPPPPARGGRRDDYGRPPPRPPRRDGYDRGPGRQRRGPPRGPGRGYEDEDEHYRPPALDRDYDYEPQRPPRRPPRRAER
jgi:hypothetical protein